MVKKNNRPLKMLYKSVVLLTMMLLAVKLYAQESVSGIVMNSKREPLPGVTITEKGRSNSVKADADGRFTIKLQDSGATLVFTYIGYKTQEQKTVGTGNIQVSLAEDIAGLDEVVVIGYGTQRKSEVTSAVVSVKSE